MTKFLNISTDNTLGGSSASDVLVASQKAVKDYVDQHGGGGGSVSIDDTTITRNTDQEIQAVATINANTATGATNPIYDWVGTEAEYVAQDIETNHPDWVCYIVDDCANTDSLIVRREVAERNIGELVYTTIPVSDSGLHLADGELLDGEGIYADFYTHMVSVYNAGHTSIFCSEADWQTSNTNYGRCGKYVLDTTNHTIRLPKIPGFVEGTLTESQIGSLVGAGLPNILGTADAMAALSGTTSGALKKSSEVGADISIAAGATYKRYTLGVDASASNPIYGNSSTVQPESIKVYVYVVIANTQKTPVQVDIDQIATELNACYSHRVVEFQEPTSTNGYTWYRKYADGWVEQGKLNCSLPSQSANNAAAASFTLPIAMKNNIYHTTWARVSDGGNTYELTQVSVERNTAYVKIWFWSTVATSGASTVDISISGMVA